ncbi:MAG: DUF2382 domain-containing protein [Phototrophicaceae bacterium]
MGNKATVIALYDSFEQAQRAIESLVNNGYKRDQISAIANDSSGEYARLVDALDLDDDNNVVTDDVDSDNGSGFGAVAGMLTGLGVALLPGVGPVVALGAWGAALIAGIGAASGAITGGIAAGLIDLGVDEEAAQIYGETVRRGGVLVTAKADQDKADDVISILNKFNPIDIEQRAEHYRSEGWTGFDETSAEPYDADTINSYRAQYTGNTLDSDTVNVEEVSAEVVQEEMKVGKREVAGGGVRLRKYVTQENVSEDVELRNEEIHVDRKSVDRPATEADFETFEEGSVTLTEKHEEAVIEKSARVVEEVTIYKDVKWNTETVEDTVRRTNVEVENVDGFAPFENYNDAFRTHYNTAYANTDYTYDQYVPAYRYGYSIASEPSFRDSDWNTLEPQVRDRWERDNDSTWDDIKDAVRHAWENVKDAVS